MVQLHPVAVAGGDPHVQFDDKDGILVDGEVLVPEDVRLKPIAGQQEIALSQRQHART